MADPLNLQILVETDLQLPSAETPRRILEAMRRHLRQHAAAAATGPGASESPLTLIQTREGQHRMPQALLPALTEACRRQGVAYTVVDRRAMVACPALRSKHRLGEDEQEAVRRLLLRDSGVLLAESVESRRAIAIELLARRQQRTLIAVDGAGEAERWLDELGESLGLAAPLIAPLRRASGETRIAVGRYSAALQLQSGELRHGFGMVVCDGLDQVDALSLMKLVRGTGARYLLGLSGAATRPDGLQGTLLLALGGIGHTLAAPQAAAETPRLGYRFRATSFDFPYQGRSQYQALMAALARDPQRAELIMADVAAEARAGHACLVLSERRDHLEQLAALLPGELAVEMLTSTVRPTDRSRGLQRFQTGEVNVLFATGQIATAAPRATRLFLTFPFAYLRKLEEPVGWLLQPAPGKGEVLAFDYDDHRVTPLHRAFEKRRSFLERLSRQAEEQAAQQAQMQLRELLTRKAYRQQPGRGLRADLAPPAGVRHQQHRAALADNRRGADGLDPHLALAADQHQGTLAVEPQLARGAGAELDDPDPEELQVHLGRAREDRRARLEAHALERLVEVELPRLSVEADPTPVEDAVGGVRGLLHLGQQHAGADGVHGAGRDRDQLTRPDRDRSQDLLDTSLGEGGLVVAPAAPFAKADVERGAGLGLEHAPGLALGTPPEARGHLGGRMHLHRERLGGIDVLHQHREAPAVEPAGAEQLPGALGAQRRQRDAAQRALGHQARVRGQIAELPGLAEGRRPRQPLAQAGQPAASPDSLLQDGVEAKRVQIDHGH